MLEQKNWIRKVSYHFKNASTTLFDLFAVSYNNAHIAGGLIFTWTDATSMSWGLGFVTKVCKMEKTTSFVNNKACYFHWEHD